MPIDVNGVRYGLSSLIAWSVFAAIAFSPIQLRAASNCWGSDANGACINVVTELMNVQRALDNESTQLKNLQLLLARLEAYEGPIDGIWGAKTEVAVRNFLEMYIAIGGRGPDWRVNSASDVSRFVGWLQSVLESRQTGGEFPD